MTSACRFVATDQPRLLNARHLRDCNASGCPGCQPCADAHCVMCGHRHLTDSEPKTCARCVGNVREDIGLIVEFAARMLPEAMQRGVNSEAAMLAGPAARAVDFTEMHVASRAGQIEAPWISLDNDDEMHPLWVLGTWDMLVSEHLGRHTELRVTIDRAADYLRDNLTVLAQDRDFAFEELAREIRECRGHLEDVLRDGERTEKGAPCPMCGARALVKAHGDTEADDRWACPGRDCSASYTEGDYRAKVEGTYVQVADRLTASQIASTYRVPERTVRHWASEKGGEVVRKRGRDEQGRILYDVADTLGQRDRAAGQVCLP